MIIKNLLKLAGAAVAGLVASVVIMLLLGALIKAAQADEAVRPATLGEQNRSLSYVPPDTITVYVVAEDIGMADCAARNRELLATVQMIANHMVARPEAAHMWAPALISIHTMWCVE